MIEAVNASVATASLIRASVDQADASRSYAANPTRVQQVPQAPYISPYVSMNYTLDKAVLQFRDSESGEVVAQIPSDTQLRAYRRAATQQPVIFEPKADAVETKRDEVTGVSSSTETISDEKSEVSSGTVETSAPIFVDTTA